MVTEIKFKGSQKTLKGIQLNEKNFKVDFSKQKIWLSEEVLDFLNEFNSHFTFTFFIQKW